MMGHAQVLKAFKYSIDADHETPHFRDKCTCIFIMNPV